jgi:hypothetical protein
MIFPEKGAPFDQTLQSIDTEQARPAGNTMSKVARRDRLFEFSLSRPADDLEQLRDQQAFVVRKQVLSALWTRFVGNRRLVSCMNFSHDDVLRGVDEQLLYRSNLACPGQ